MSSTYALLEEFTRLVTTAYDSDEEMDSAIAAWLDDQEDKLHGLYIAKKRFEAEANVCRQEARAFNERAASHEKRAESMAQLAAVLLERRAELGEEPKVKTPYYTAYLSSRTVVAGPEDPSQWPEQFIRVELSPNKKAAEAALKGGETYDGLSLVKRTYACFR